MKLLNRSSSEWVSPNLSLMTLQKLKGALYNVQNRFLSKSMNAFIRDRLGRGWGESECIEIKLFSITALTTAEFGIFFLTCPCNREMTDTRSNGVHLVTKVGCKVLPLSIRKHFVRDETVIIRWSITENHA